MASVAGDIAVRVGADTSGLTKGLADADRSLQAFGAKAGAAVGNIAALSAAAVAAGAAIAASLAAKGFAAVDALDEMAEKSGTSAKSLQALQLALGEAGINSDQTQAAIKRLNVAIGDAQSGNKTAQATFDKLGLSVSELSAMDADARFAAIGDALSGYGNAADRASIATDLFGQKVGPELAVALAAGGDGIRQASADLESMGLAMDSVDAAQVANAMDAFGRAQMVIDGISNKLAVEFAPLLEAVSKSFLEAGKEGQGFGGVVTAAVEATIKTIAFLANAIDGIKRIGVAVSDALVYGFALVQETFLKLARNVVAGLDMIPGIDLTANVVALEEKIKTSQGVMREAAANMRRQFEEPLAGDVFLQYAAQAKKASEEGAAAAIKAREAVQGGEATGGGELEKQKALDAEKLAAKQAALQAEIEAELWAESEKAANKEKADHERIAAELARIDEQYLTEQDKLAMKLEAENAIIAEAREAGLISKEESDRRELEALLGHQSAMTAIDAQASEERKRQAEQEAAAKKAILSQAFGGLTALMNSESRKMFEIGKAASIAQAIVSTYTGMAKALELGFPLGPIAAGAIALTGFAQVANIRKQSFGGGGGSAASATSNTGAINAANTPVASGGGGGGASSPSQLVNISLVGDSFGREGVLNLIEKINDATQNGGARLRFS